MKEQTLEAKMKVSIMSGAFERKAIARGAGAGALSLSGIFRGVSK